MHSPRALSRLETDRLILRNRDVAEAAIYRQLWSERDPRVPPHRRIDSAGRPTVDDIAASIRAEEEACTPGYVAVQRRAEADVIGYCGLIERGKYAEDDLELVYELLQHAHGVGYATEATRALLTWAAASGYPSVWASVRDWNHASRRVLQKLGFVRTEVDPDPVYGDSLIFARKLSARQPGDSAL
ncbi:MAG TPA: GNAT family N-acetyltransferase [Microlunatus sp.]